MSHLKKLKHVNVVDSAKQVILSACVSICSLCVNFHVDAVHVCCLEGNRRGPGTPATCHKTALLY